MVTSFIVYDKNNKSDFDKIEVINYNEARKYAENFKRDFLHISIFEKIFEEFIIDRNDEDLKKPYFHFTTYLQNDGKLIVNRYASNQELEIIRSSNIEYEFVSILDFVKIVNTEQRNSK